MAIGLIPIILNWNLNISDVSIHPDGSFVVPLQQGIISIHHQLAMTASLASFYPLAAELLTDSIFLSRSQRSNYGCLSQWLLVIGLYVALIGYWIMKQVFAAPSWAVADGDFLAASNCHISVVGVLVLVFEGHNLLLYDRLSGNMLTLNNKKLNAKKFIKESLRPFYRQVNEKNLLLNLEFVNDNGNVTMDGPIFINGDRGKLVQ
eukprot:gene12981-27399_t